MEIILLNNGFGVARGETIFTSKGNLPLVFAGAPENSTVTRICNRRSVVRRLGENGSYLLDLSDVEGEVKFNVTSDGKVWVCDSLIVTREEDGVVSVRTAPDYLKQITYCLDEIRSLRDELDSVRKSVQIIREKLDLVENPYKLI